MKKFRNYRGGIIALPIVVLLTVIIISIAVGLSAVSYNENVNSVAISKSAMALEYALAGARDALAKISRNNTYSETTWNDATDATNGSYKIKINSLDCSASLDGCARVRVDYNSTFKNPIIITSEGVSGDYKRKIQVDAILDTNGYISLITEAEVKSLPIVSTGRETTAGGVTTLNGWVNPNGNTAARAWFRYGQQPPAQCSDTFTGGTSTTIQPINPGSPSNMFPIAFSQDLPGLSPGFHYYCAIADDGTTKVYGNIFVFTAI